MAIDDYSFLDIFAGAGGWSIGFEEAGFKHAAMYDWNESACRTAARNFGDIVHRADLHCHKEIDFPAVDIVCGSPPCQGFSNEGKKQKDDPRNSLVWSYLEIVRRIQPRVWIFENVPGFQRSYGGHYFKLLVDELENWNYRWNHFLVDAARYGVPQNRLRFILIAARDFAPRLPVPTHGPTNDMFGTQKYVSLWDAISDLPVPPLGDRDGRYPYDSEPNTDYQRWARRESRAIFNHTTQNHSERVLEKIRSVPIGGDMRGIVESFEENRVHYCGGYRRAAMDRPSWTAYWTRGMTSIHPLQDRFLSPRECARIQSFPDRFIFDGTTIENYTQVCNAVPLYLRERLQLAFASNLRLRLDRRRGLRPLGTLLRTRCPKCCCNQRQQKMS